MAYRNISGKYRYTGWKSQRYVGLLSEKHFEFYDPGRTGYPFLLSIFRDLTISSGINVHLLQKERELDADELHPGFLFPLSCSLRHG